MYKCLEECIVDNNSRKYFFKKHYGIDLSMFFIHKRNTIRDFEYMYELESSG